MSASDWNEQLRFVKAKAALMDRYLSRLTSESVLLVYRSLGTNEYPAPQSSEAYLIGDKELNKLIDTLMAAEDATTIRAELKKEFGCSSLSDTPERILKKILRRGRILDQDEARAVVDTLDAIDFSPSPLGRQKKLTALLREYENAKK